MVKQLSFTKIEQNVQSHFRQRINTAESTEDVKKFFTYTVKELFNTIFKEKIRFDNEDISLKSRDESLYTLNDRLYSLDEFSSVWNQSDLPNVVERLAKKATNRYIHLEKNSEKTRLKIRM